MNHYSKVLFSSILAGILISIGGIIFLSVKNISLIAGGFLFAFGLFTIIVFKLHLYTGKIGYIVDNKNKYLLELLIILVGNIIGAFLMGMLARLMCLNSNSTLINTVVEVTNNKLSNSLLTSFILSMLCGIMIFIAVEVSRKEVSDLIKMIAIFFSVAIFIIAGFEHCIANMFYFSFANQLSLNSFVYLIVMIIGNSLGSIIIYLLFKLALVNKKG